MRKGKRGRRRLECRDNLLPKLYPIYAWRKSDFTHINILSHKAYYKLNREKLCHELKHY